MAMRFHHFFLLSAALAAVAASSCTCGSRPATQVLTPEGEPCSDDEECETGLCDALDGENKKCLRKCTSGCKGTDVCEPLVPGRYACVPERAGLCTKKCETDSECPWPGDKCIVLGTEKFCGRDCSFDGTCPPTFRCADATTTSGERVQAQCQPASGTCDCVAASAGQVVPCEVANGFGRCIGNKTCRPPEGFSECSARTPTQETCNGEDDDCDGQVDEGLGDLTCGVGECARSAAACANGVPQTCTPGAPVAETCNQKDDDCDGTVDDGFDKMTDVLNCGACGNACSFPHAIPRCVMGVCGIDRCQPGWSDLDGVPSNGCEYPCTPSDAGVEECNGVDDDCDGLVDEDFNLASDPNNCGQCNLVCQVPGNSVATYQCVARTCGILACVPGRGDCNQLYADGCEVNLLTDVAHCGGCARPCVTPNATPQCTGGTCGILTCNPGHADCNGQVADGCEVNTNTSTQHCGACGNVCSAPNATPSCVSGSCTFTCLPNWWNVDGQAANGCEYACVRTNGGVEACDNIDNDCNGQVDETFDLTRDPNHCGQCNRACVAPYATTVCSSSACAIASCDVGRANCNGVYADGCEVDTRTSLAHCGACNAPCAPAHAVPVCANGSCGIASCLPGYWNLNGLVADGCEYACVQTNNGIEACDGLDNDCDGAIDEGFSLATDPNNCGACGNVCSRPNTAPSCANGTCQFTCLPNFWDLDGNPANGCEYACTYLSATDTPDLGLVDANCDGIDGEWNNAVFVAPSGNDANPGTPALPKRTISAGLAQAVATNKRDVLVAGGTYNEQVTIDAPGKGVYGGYTAPSWTRSQSTAVTVTGVNAPLVITSAAGAVVQLVNFVGANAVGTSASAYGAFISNSPNVRLEKVSISAGNGTAGTHGAAGTNGANGNPGQAGRPGCEDDGTLFCTRCSQPAGGAGGTSACGRTGGTGGLPGKGNSYGGMGSPGVGGTPGGPGTPPGQGNWTTPPTYWGQNGANGTDGANGINGASFGMMTAAGYVPALTTAGGNGTHGNGGGGGGGGGGGTSYCHSYGGSGGGGGAGGCGGLGGSPGLSGGGSFAVYLWGSSVHAVDCTLVSGNGGNGGNGGAGGQGGTGGSGGPQNPYGGSGEQDDGSNGGRGGAGGNGGKGGVGGSGGGGPSVGVARGNGSTWSATGTTISTGMPGFGGTAAGSGAMGLRTDVY